MKNKLTDLNNHLFAQLERLGDESIKGEGLSAEVDRAKSITEVAKVVVMNANLQLDAIKLKAEYRGLSDGDIPKIISEQK